MKIYVREAVVAVLAASLLAASLGVILGVSLWIFLGSGHKSTRINTGSKSAVTQTGLQTVYITNLAPQYWSNASIKRDIPAWETALNRDFASYWHTNQYRLVFLGNKPAPQGQMSAVIQAKGPIKGALAYHWTERNNAPSITVYAGTGDYYGYDNSISMTHELEELAADPVTSYVNQGYPDDFYWLESKDMSLKYSFQYSVAGWFNEVSDPVEADFYKINGVKISDFVTPAWFNDGVGSRYDFMGLCQQPFWIRPGGYAQYLSTQLGWQIVTNFRRGNVTDAGFLRSDPRGRS